MKINDKVVVNDKLIVAQEGEEQFINQTAVIALIDNYCFPIELKFESPGVQKLYEQLGKRRFDYHELSPVK